MTAPAAPPGSMRWDGVYVESAAVELGELHSAREAVAAGLLSAEEARTTRQRSVSVSQDRSGPELAVAAGRKALANSGRDPLDVGLLIHADCWYQGLDFWNTAAYVQHEVLGHGACTAFELRQMSNGGMSALETAAARLTAVPTGAALITTGDRFAAPDFPRWTTDRGLAFGDAGTSVLVSARPGPLRLVATATWSEPLLEGLHRGDEPFRPAAGRAAGPLDLVARKKGFLRHHRVEEINSRNASGMLTSVRNCLAAAGVEKDGLARVVVPFFGAKLSRLQCLEPLGLSPAVTLQEWGLTIGHLGAGDQLAGLARILEEDSLAPGDKILLVGVGAGFSWTCAVLERQ